MRKTPIEYYAPDLRGIPAAQPTPRPNTLPVAMAPVVSVPAPVPFKTPATVWGARRMAQYQRSLTDLTNAQTGYLRARAEMSKAFVAAARAANEVAELPEICEHDTQVRRLHRERDFLNARTEVEQARYGLLATQAEVDKLRAPRMKRAARNNAAAIDALMRTKVDMEALGEDTRGLDESLVLLKQG